VQEGRQAAQESLAAKAPKPKPQENIRKKEPSNLLPSQRRMLEQQK